MPDHASEAEAGVAPATLPAGGALGVSPGMVTAQRRMAVSRIIRH